MAGAAVVSWWTVGWVAWVGMFLALELPAVFNAVKNDTFSEHVWMVTKPFLKKWFKASPVVWIGRGVTGTLLVWLFGHFLFGIWSL